MVYKKLIIIFSFFVLVSCVNNNEKEIKDVITNDNLESDMIEAYNEGLKALNLGDASYASKKFNEAELLFPQSEWAPKALLMSSYAYWSQRYYSNSISELKRFIEVYPTHKNLDYAYYLLAINYYDIIADEKKDLKSLLESKKYFEIHKIFKKDKTKLFIFISWNFNWKKITKILQNRNSKNNICKFNKQHTNTRGYRKYFKFKYNINFINKWKSRIF